MDEEEFVFVIKYGGHWGARGWTYYKKRFREAKEAYSFYCKARAPKEVQLKFYDGFSCALTDAGMRRHFGAFMGDDRKSSYSSVLKKSKNKFLL